MKKVMGLLLLVVNLSLANDCVTPKPFVRLSADKAQQYKFQEIIQPLLPAKTTADNDESIKLVNFWASWCGPCRDELPLLEELKQHNALTVQLVNIDDEPQQAQKVLEELNVKQLGSLYAHSEMLSDLSIRGLPASVVWAPQQQVFLGVGKLKDKTALSEWLACLALAKP